MSTGKIVIGTLAGLTIGATAGILFAPKKGSKTRKQIMNKGEDYVDGIKSKYDELSDSIMGKFKGVKKDAEELVDKGKTKYNDAKRDVKNETADSKHDHAADKH